MTSLKVRNRNGIFVPAARLQASDILRLARTAQQWEEELGKEEAATQAIWINQQWAEEDPKAFKKLRQLIVDVIK